MQRSRLINIFLAVIVVITVVLSFFTIRALFFTDRITISQPSLYNAFQPIKVSDTTFRYYNGNTFVEYNNNKDTISPLTNLVSLYDVQNVYWYKNGVIFNTNAVRDTSDIAKPYQTFTAGLDTLGSVTGPEAFPPELVFWNLSFTTNTLTPIGPYNENFINGVMSSDGGYVFDYVDSFAKITPNGDLQLAYTPLFGTEDMKLLRATDTAIFYTSKENDAIKLNRYNIATNTSDTLVENIYSDPDHNILEPVYMLDDTSVYYLEDSGISGGVGLSNVIKKDIKTSSTKNIVSNVQGFLERASADELTFVHIGKSVLEVTTITKAGAGFTKEVASTDELVVSSFSSHPDTIYFEANGKAYNIQNNNSTPREGYKQALEVGYTSENASLSRNIFDTNDNSYTLTVVKGSVKAELDKVFTYITSKKLNPYEFTIMTVRGAGASD